MSTGEVPWTKFSFDEYTRFIIMLDPHRLDQRGEVVSGARDHIACAKWRLGDIYQPHPNLRLLSASG
jgi:hypothetical protein